ncbi:unnamed protein product [Adineta steineri]|uniref:G-protein coupled receptors family 1 profile domain-containing protein n=1 Tax=Adineta steineri TaxID=433720 RepID=A0A819H9E6_9BILA|nr:unnamed protein product [Adineta steineri]CAF3899970.1 unnamed protein product [Adineta steineri]
MSLSSVGEQLTIYVGSVILIAGILGSGFDLTRTSLAWCKARSFFLSTISVISFTCLCLATIDQFLATSQNAHLRRYNKIELAHRIVLVAIVVCIIPYGINNAYGLITAGMTKDVNQQVEESFISTIVGLIAYLYYMGNFYMFLISSSRFRHAVADRIIYGRNPNRINPT